MQRMTLALHEYKAHQFRHQGGIRVSSGTYAGRNLEIPEIPGIGRCGFRRTVASSLGHGAVCLLPRLGQRTGRHAFPTEVPAQLSSCSCRYVVIRTESGDEVTVPQRARAGFQRRCDSRPLTFPSADTTGLGTPVRQLSRRCARAKHAAGNNIKVSAAWRRPEPGISKPSVLARPASLVRSVRAQTAPLAGAARLPGRWPWAHQ
jgi:hypothetical protein